MFVKFKGALGKIEKCECRDADCPKRGCFAPGYYQHRGCLGSGGGSKSSGYDDYKSCMNRNYHGCDDSIKWYDTKENKEESK